MSALPDSLAARVDDVVARPELADVTWSLELRVGGARAAVNSAELLPTASIGKLFLLIEVAARLESGDLAPDTLLDRHDVDDTHDSGVWQHLTTSRLPVVDVAALVGCASDNWATNVLLDLVGLDAVQARAAELAPGGSTLLDQVRSSGRDPELHPWTLSLGCAADWAAFMEGLVEGTVVSTGVSRRVLNWIQPSLDLSMVLSALGADPLSSFELDRGLTHWNKTGTNQGIRADVGYVAGPVDAAAYAVLANWEVADERDELRDHVLAAMRDLGLLIRQGVSP